MRRAVGLSALAIVTLVVVGFSAGLLLTVPPMIPPSLASDSTGTLSFEPSQLELDDARDVQLTVSLGGQTQLAAPDSGTVTALSCSAGDPFSSWQSNVSIDGTPLLNLAAATPLWRDLKSGDVGPDVRGIQDELGRLGYGVVSDGVLGQFTISVVNDRLKDLGATISDPLTLARSSILWVPGPDVPVGSCALALGAPVMQGADVAKLQPVISSVRVTTMPASLVPGDRVVIIDGETFQVDDLGAISVPTELARFASRPEFLSSVLAAAAGVEQPSDGSAPGSAESSAGLSGQLRLATAVEAWVVPPGALASIDGTHACVSDEGIGIAVTIVGSQLGKSYVTFQPDQTVPSVVELAPGGVTC